MSQSTRLRVVRQIQAGPTGRHRGGFRVSRFTIVITQPYQERAIVNIDAIAAVTSKTGTDGIRTAQLAMVDGSKIVITASFADLEQALGASPLGAPVN